jgi:hypothetical protein
VLAGRRSVYARSECLLLTALHRGKQMSTMFCAGSSTSAAPQPSPCLIAAFATLALVRRAVAAYP